MFEDLLPAKAEFRKLAQKDAHFKKCLQVASLPRIADVVQGGVGEVEVDVSFGYNHKYQVEISGSLKANITLVCQRCMNPMDVSIGTDIKIIVITEDRVGEVERTSDPFIASEDWIDLNALVQEELLLALPFVSYHNSDECHRKKSENMNPSSVNEELGDTPKNPFHVLSSLKESNKE